MTYSTEVFDAKPGPRVGDFCRRANGDLCRIAAATDDTIKLVRLSESQAKFTLADGDVYYTGPVDDGEIEISSLTRQAEGMKGAVQILRPGQSPENEMVPCRVYIVANP